MDKNKKVEMKKGSVKEGGEIQFFCRSLFVYSLENNITYFLNAGRAISYLQMRRALSGRRGEARIR